MEAPILVRTSRSSQNAQGGRTRPFRMLARAIWKDGTPIDMILPDVSEPFVVSSGKTLPECRSLSKQFTHQKPDFKSEARLGASLEICL